MTCHGPDIHRLRVFSRRLLSFIESRLLFVSLAQNLIYQYMIVQYIFYHLQYILVPHLHLAPPPVWHGRTRGEP